MPHERGPFYSAVEGKSPYFLDSQSERIFNNPPQLILVLDNWRGESPRNRYLAKETMFVRSCIAAGFYHSTLYQEDSRPKIACFAGAHLPQEQPGSQTVAKMLLDLGVSPDDLVLRQNTITTTTDILQLAAYAFAYDISNILIVTTDDHVKRVRTELRNHFFQGGRNKRRPTVEVLGPSAKVLNHLSAPNAPHSVRRQINISIGIGKSNELNHGWQEIGALGLASLPNERIRIKLQSGAEKLTHPYTPRDLKRILKIAKKIKTAWIHEEKPDRQPYIPPPLA